MKKSGHFKYIYLKLTVLLHFYYWQSNSFEDKEIRIYPKKVFDQDIFVGSSERVTNGETSIGIEDTDKIRSDKGERNIGYLRLKTDKRRVVKDE